jgi:iron complex outermembrane receptor protein
MRLTTILLVLIGFLSAQAAQVTGKVTDAQTGDPLVGCNILVQGTFEGTTSLDDGSYSLEANPGDVLVVSYIGYVTQEINVEEGATSINISLKTDVLRQEGVAVVGSRFNPRTVITSPVPIDNLKIRELYSTGQNGLDHMLSYKVPSYNASQQTISDATAHFDPAELRGLGPSRTLVLINGKRKHASSMIYINDTPGKGEVGVDMKSIPTAAIDRVEVLRDGASAQYGSDAIAGVINVIMKEKVEYTEVNVTAGQTAGGHKNAGDGFNMGANINHGMNIGDKGSLNITASYHDQEETRRAGEPGGDGLFGFLYAIGAIPIQAAGGWEATPGSGVPATGAQIQSGDTDWQKANPDLGTHIGIPNMTTMDLFLNGSYDLNDDMELYSFGGFTNRVGKSYALYRAPYWPGVSDSHNLIDGPKIGFQPTFETDITDNSLTAGIRGTMSSWQFDVSASSGRNKVDYSVNNSLNMDLGAASPTEFKPGGYEFGHTVANADVANAFGKMSLGLGMEYRLDNFVALAGDEASWTGGGVQSFPGIQEQNAVNESRSNIGFYGDVEYDVTDDLLVGAAGRFENYSDFGTSVTWKANGRYKMMDDNLSVRGSVSTGFRAPSLHQMYMSNIQTLLSAGTVSNQGTYNNESAIVASLGVDKLKEENSFNMTFGFAFKPMQGLYTSFDYYDISVDDRIVYSSSIASSDETTQVYKILTAANITSLKFFTNAVDTKTSGMDIVVSYSGMKLGPGTLDVNLAANVNETEIVGAIATPAPITAAGVDLFDRKEQSRIETARPAQKATIGLTYNMGGLSIALNNTRFGEVTWRHAAGNASLDYDDKTDQTFSAKMLTDLYLSYQINEMLGLSLVVNNLGDVYPDKINTKGDFEADLGGRFEYPWEVNQFGFTGMTILGGLTVRF